MPDEDRIQEVFRAGDSLEKTGRMVPSDYLLADVRSFEFSGYADPAVNGNPAAENMADVAAFVCESIWCSRSGLTEETDSNRGLLESLYLSAKDIKKTVVTLRRWEQEVAGRIPRILEKTYLTSYMKQFKNLLDSEEDGDRRMEKEFLVSGIMDRDKSMKSVYQQVICLEYVMRINAEEVLLHQNMMLRSDFYKSPYRFQIYYGSSEPEEDVVSAPDVVAPLMFQFRMFYYSVWSITETGADGLKYRSTPYESALENLMYSVSEDTLISRAGLLIEDHMRKSDPGFSLQKRNTRVKAELAGSWKNLTPLPSFVADQPVVEKALPKITVESVY